MKMKMRIMSTMIVMKVMNRMAKQEEVGRPPVEEEAKRNPLLGEEAVVVGGAALHQPQKVQRLLEEKHRVGGEDLRSHEHSIVFKLLIFFFFDEV